MSRNQNEIALLDVFLYLFGITSVIGLNFSIYLKWPHLLIVQWIGLTQLIYVIPLVLYLKHKRIWALMAGVITGAVLSFLLAGFCGLIDDWSPY